jgi:antirestriction protein ArdC/phage/plasmid primase-like uncharacterized protein
MMTKKPYHETVAENLIKQLEAGTAPWQKPWSSGMPINPTTGKRYKGINAIHLMAQNRSDPRWMTYKQAIAQNAQVRKGEKGTLIQYWKFHEERNKKDDNGKVVLDDKGNPVKETIKLARPKSFSATVFNAQQIDGLPELKPIKPWNSIERAEHILQQSNAALHHGEPDGAFYRPSTDSIHLPNKEQFPSAENYYSVALHELGHWTGHASRLNRDLSHPFGSEGYAREELRAEIGSMILSSELGISHDTSQHAAYVGSWIKALKEDPLEVFRAASDAEKISQFVMSFDMKQTDTQEQKEERQYLAVPYEDKALAKDAGARWDKEQKSWYAENDSDMKKLSQWLPENIQATTKLSPKEEFAQALASIGCEVDGEHPIMDGQKHRIRVETDKPSVKHQAGSGYYVGYLDGHPAGFMKNYKTGEELKWKSDNHQLDPQEQAKIRAQAAEKQAARLAEQKQVQLATAERVSKQLECLQPITTATPYITKKGIQPHSGIFTDTQGKTTYIPAFDEDGKQWNMQYIQEDGTKRFAKDSRKEGCFHVVGGNIDTLKSVPAIVLQEGYATAATISETTGFATVAAFDSSNLPKVAKVLHEKFPDKPIIIFGDDDRHLEMTQGVNAGRTKALEAAEAVGGQAVFPIFSDDAYYPANLEPITPDSYRNHVQATKGTMDNTHLLSQEQLRALENMKPFTDFNDLASSSPSNLAKQTQQVLVGLANKATAIRAM